MTTHSSILAWEIPLTEETGGLQSTGSQRIRHNSATKQQQYELAAVSLIFKRKMLWILNTWWNKIQYFGTWCGYQRKAKENYKILSSLSLFSLKKSERKRKKTVWDPYHDIIFYSTGQCLIILLWHSLFLYLSSMVFHT